jgi:hypothetical protein
MGLRVRHRSEGPAWTRASGLAAVTTPYIFRRLIRVKQRRVDQLEVARDTARAAEQEARQALAAAQHNEQTCRRAERVHQDKITAMSTSRRFFASDLVTMSLISEALAGETRMTQKATAQAERAAEATHESTLNATRALQRGEQQLERVKARLDQMIAAAAAAQEDIQDEDSEEAAVSRLIARSREAAAA